MEKGVLVVTNRAFLLYHSKLFLIHFIERMRRLPHHTPPLSFFLLQSWENIVERW
jgi:hypothetical protein